MYSAFTMVWSFSFGIACGVLHLLRVFLAMFTNPKLVFCASGSGFFKLLFQYLFFLCPWGIFVSHPPLPNEPNAINTSSLKAARQGKTTTKQLKSVPVEQNPISCFCPQLPVAGILFLLWLADCLINLIPNFAACCSDADENTSNDNEVDDGYKDPRLEMCKMVALHPWDHKIYFLN
jgi:hypothetical protein